MTEWNRHTIARYMWLSIPAATRYWSDVESGPDSMPLDPADDNPIMLPEFITLTEHDGDAHTLTFKQYTAALTKWARVGKDYGNEYQATAARDMLASKWDQVDYDHETVDLTTQFALFGEILYS